MMTRVGPQVPHRAALALLQPETGEPPAKCVCEAMAANRFVPGKRLQPFANQGVKKIQSSTRPGTRTSRRSAVRAEKKKERLAVEKPSGVATHGGDLNEGTSQSGAFARRVLRNVMKSCKAFVQLVTTDDCRTADVQRGLTCIGVLSQKKGF